MNRRPLLTLAVATCLALAGAPLPAHAAETTWPDRVAGIQAELDAAVAAGVPGVVYFVRDGNLSTVLTAGLGDVTRATPIRADDRFRIASITKSFVAVTILRLVDRHVLGLDDPVQRWLPGLVPDARVTIRQLLGHTSGLFDYAEDADWQAAVVADLTRRWTPDEVIAIALAHPAVFAPGTSYGYSNTDYAVLGEVARAATGRSMASLVTDLVIRPLGLRDTYVSHTSTIRGQHAHGYTSGGFLGSPDSGLRDVTRMNATLAVTSGDVISTVEDVATFFRALLDGRLLPAGPLAQMTDMRPTGEGDPWAYGLGLQRNPTDCGVSIGHAGGIFGFSSDAGESPDQTHQAVVFANTDSIPEGAFAHFGRASHLSYCDD